MNLITADFNWFSLVVIVVAGIISIRKSRSGKSGRPFETNLPEFEPWTAKPEEEHWDEKEWERTEEPPVSPEMSEVSEQSNQYPEQETSASVAPEEEKEEQPAFDIRQAIIGSEILKRPEF
ncbi:MAG: hypothetical protein K2I90_07445 [Odoribacter sp.]|nr:hypothetical protein [Odoribacter sp.]